MTNLLIVEDEHALGGALVVAIRKMGHTPILVGSGALAKKELGRTHVSAVILDIGLPDMSGVEVLRWIRESGSKVPVLIITAHATLDHAIAARKLGVADYLIKPLDLVAFENAVSAMVAKGGFVASVEDSPSPTLIGASAAMHQVFLDVARACVVEMPVLISGPSGSGKTHTARVIHGNRGHAIHGLRVHECSRIADDEALRAVFAEAEGTILLENVNDLSIPMQAMLANRLSGAGGSSPSLMATMQMNPREAVAAGVLREDLYYALSAMMIEVPPLVERVGDIPALSRFFAAIHQWKQPNLELSVQALSALQSYAWPGNVRELRHVLEHARAMSRGETVYLGHLPPHVATAWSGAGRDVVSQELEMSLARWLDLQVEITPQEELRYETVLNRMEAAVLGHLLRKFEDKPTHLAAAMQMNRATLRQKMRRLRLERQDGDV